jgi:hypothetical protein
MQDNRKSKDAAALRMAFDLAVWTVAVLTALALLAYEVGV